ncbi:hypothetical protein VNO80_07693 [Phaseolus coccineus]|uniref:Uncharacterized protein n=1 Tax=Phaseolus coccineus TaxID=3886 RepID=A0AAN9NJJ5_PHACN
MDLGAENGKVVEPWDVCKSKGRKKKKGDEEMEGAGSGCWLRLRLPCYVMSIDTQKIASAMAAVWGLLQIKVEIEM